MLLNAKKIYLKLALTALVGVTAVSALAAEKPAPVGDYEAREWGVIVGCESSQDSVLTSRPLRITYVKEPVLYFHSRDKKPFALKVVFNQGIPTETYPVAAKNGNTIRWERVSFPAQTAPVVTKGLKAAPELVPFNEIVDTLNDVDADEVESGGTKAKFLFYEGEMPFVNQIKSTYDPNTKEATVVNNSSYVVFDLFVFVPDPTGVHNFMFSKDPLIAYLPQLKPGETVRVKPEPVTQKIDFVKPLRDLGFTAKEAASFDSIWYNSFLKFGKLLYRLPLSECDRLIRLEFNPQPQKISRALFVLVKK